MRHARKLSSMTYYPCTRCERFAFDLPFSPQGDCSYLVEDPQHYYFKGTDLLRVACFYHSFCVLYTMCPACGVTRRKVGTLIDHSDTCFLPLEVRVTLSAPHRSRRSAATGELSPSHPRRPLAPPLPQMPRADRRRGLNIPRTHTNEGGDASFARSKRRWERGRHERSVSAFGLWN